VYSSSWNSAFLDRAELGKSSPISPVSDSFQRPAPIQPEVPKPQRCASTPPRLSTDTLIMSRNICHHLILCHCGCEITSPNLWSECATVPVFIEYVSCPPVYSLQFVILRLLTQNHSVLDPWSESVCACQSIGIQRPNLTAPLKRTGRQGQKVNYFWLNSTWQQSQTICFPWFRFM
jgi:hypothetical protein